VVLEAAVRARVVLEAAVRARVVLEAAVRAPVVRVVVRAAAVRLLREATLRETLFTVPVLFRETLFELGVRFVATLFVDFTERETAGLPRVVLFWAGAFRFEVDRLAADLDLPLRVCLA